MINENDIKAQAELEKLSIETGMSIDELKSLYNTYLLSKAITTVEEMLTIMTIQKN